MVDGPSPERAVRSLIRSYDGDDESGGNYGWTALAGEPLSVFAGVRAAEDPAAAEPWPLRVWRDGTRARIEEPDGTPNLIVGDDTCWRFEPDHEAPTASPARAVHYAGSGTQLLTRRNANEFTGDDFTRRTGPVAATRFPGRSAWTVELAPPEHKPYPIQLVVDAETGVILPER
jgi:hypothetical protein